MRKLIFLMFFLTVFLARAQVIQGIRGEFRDSVTSYTNNTDLELNGKGTGSVFVDDSLTVSGNISFTGTGATKINVGTQAQRPSPVNGMIRYRTDDEKFEGYENGEWKEVITEGTGAQISGTPVTNDYARWTDANTIEGRSYSEVRGDLGLEIGTDVQAWDANLDDIAGLSDADGNFIVGSASGWVAESGATVRTSLGLGTIATQNANSVDIDGGEIDGTVIGGTTPAAGSFTTLKVGSSTLAAREKGAFVGTENNTVSLRLTNLSTGTAASSLLYLSETDGDGLSPVFIQRFNSTHSTRPNETRFSSTGKLELLTSGNTGQLDLNTNGTVTLSSLSGTGTRVRTTTSAGLQTALANGTDGQVMTMVSGSPAWADNEGAPTESTATLTVGGGNTVSSQSVRYSIVGNKVTVVGFILLDANSDTNNFTITGGLPGTLVSGGRVVGSFFAGNGQSAGTIRGASITTIQCYKGSGGLLQYTEADTTSLDFVFTYFID